MKLLLDTHIFLWFINGDSRLPVATLAAIRDPGNQIYLSAVCFWEVAVKYQLGKLPLPDSPEIFLPSIHRDPFDRMLISQALHHGLTLVSEDALVRSYPAVFLN